MERTVERHCTFAGMAERAGLPVKGAYTLSEVSKASGVPLSALYGAAERGRLETFLPPGMEKGLLVVPEWFDAWFDAGRSSKWL